MINAYRYNHQIIDEIVERLCNGETLRHICRVDEWGDERERGSFPSIGTVYQWCSNSSPNYDADICLRISEARIINQHVMLEETIEIADTPEWGEEITEEEVENDTKDGTFVKTVKRTVKKEMTAHRQMRIAARQKYLQMYNPDLWAGKIKAAGDGDDEGDVTIHGGLPD